MKPKVRRLAVIVGASAALGGAGCGGAARTENSSAQTSTAGRTQSGSPANDQAQPGPGGFDVTALVGKLGVSASKLRAAMEKARPTGTPGQSPGANSDPATALANELGLSAAKVRAAMQALAPAGAPPQGTPPSGATAPSGGTSGGKSPHGAPATGTNGTAPPAGASGRASGSATQGMGRSTTSGSAA